MSNRIWIAGTAIAVVVVIALGWVLGISPRLAESALADQQRAEASAQNALLEAELAALQTQFEGMDGLERDLEELRKELPPDADLANFIRHLDELAIAHGVTTVTMSTGGGSLYVPAGGASEESGPSTAPGAVTSPLVTSENFITIPVTLTVEGGYDAVLGYLNGLQNGERIFLVSAFNLSGGAADGGANTGVITGMIYVLLDPTYTPEGGVPADAAAPEEEPVEPEQDETPAP